jgi:hypothetical protein
MWIGRENKNITVANNTLRGDTAPWSWAELL